MKKFKIFTIAMLLTAFTTTFTSCAGSEDKKDDDKKEEKNDDKKEEIIEDISDDKIELDENAVGAGCVGGFYDLKKDLNDLFITNIKNGSIKLGKTTKSEMEKIIGAGDFKKEYDGLRVSGYVSYTGDIVNSITLDYFYDCEGAMSLLSIDKEDITSSVSEYLETTGEPDGDYEDAGTTWKVGNQIISQSNFPDGYTISISK